MAKRFFGVAVVALATWLAAAAPAATAQTLPEPQITEITKSGDQGGASAVRAEYQLGDTVVVALDQPTKPEDGLTYRLLLNDVPVASAEPKAATQTLRFRLLRAPAPDTAWKSLLGAGFPVGRRTLTVAVEWTTKKDPAARRLAFKPDSPLAVGGIPALELIAFEIECVVRPPGNSCPTTAEMGLPYNFGEELVVRIRSGEPVDPAAWQLFLNDRAVTDARAAARTADGKGLRFQLIRSDATRVGWAALMSSTQADRTSPTLSLGRTDQTEEKRAAGAGAWASIQFQPGGGKSKFFAYFIVAISTSIFGVILCTDMVRDNVLPGVKRKGQPFSLNRIQLAAWLVVIAGSFAFLLIYMHDWAAMSAQALALLGIAAATSAGARIADGMNADKRNELIKAAGDPAPGVPLLDSAEGKLEPYGKQNWYQDIFYENDSPSLHRLQMVGFTVMMLALWVWRVFNELAMPNDISENLIGLMGLSGGTYVALKAVTTK